MRSFSNLWYWIGLAVLWSTTSHWVLGVPYDMIQRARKHGGQSAADLHDLVRINCNRMLFIGTVAGMWMLAFVTGIITSLFIMGFWYRIEFAQALFFFVFPVSIVGLISLSAARQIQTEQAEGEQLYKRLLRHRLYIQIIGMISVFVTSMWGMFQNLAIGALGS